MGTEGSVAPKERVNIVYRPATGDAKEEVELPLKTLVMGDFTNRKEDTPLEDRKSINIDKNNFNDVLAAQNISMDLAVPNRLDAGKQDETIAMKLKIKALKDFEPDSIVDQIPELRKMVELRDALKALKGPLGNIPDFRKKLQELVQDTGARSRLLSELGIDEKSE
ncbi:MAG: type VI secretion system contractile sheath small subunit [Nitrospinae bacterium]|nr:type VI secretion system contractile sheath small subunit [Nitrospinota bacterium]